MKVLAGPHNWGYFTEGFALGLEAHDSKIFRFAEDEGELSLQWTDKWSDLAARLPSGWEPDWVVWWMPEYMRAMPGIEECPYRTLLVVSDWNVISEPLYRYVEAFDVVATDAMGVERLSRYGVDVPVFQAPMYGFVPSLHRSLPDVERNIPVGYVGNTNGVAYRDRMKTLAAACNSLGRGQVTIASGVYGEDYVRLLNRFQITLNHSLRGELNMRTFEAMACGSLLFCESDNREARGFFKDEEHLIYFTEENLVDRLRYYLKHDRERQEIARAGLERVQDFSYQRCWGRLLEKADDLYQPKPRPFLSLPESEKRKRYCDYSYHVFSPLALGPTVTDATNAAAKATEDEELRNILGCSLAFLSDLGTFGDKEVLLGMAESTLNTVDGLGLLPLLSLARVLTNLGRADEAAILLKAAAQQKLPVEQVASYPRLMHPHALLTESEPDSASRERTARWYLHDLLSGILTEERAEQCRLALSFRDDIPTTWLRLSCCEDLSLEERVEALTQTVRCAPFFMEAHARRLELAPRRTPHYSEWVEEASVLVEALAGPDFETTREIVRERIREAVSGEGEQPLIETTIEFAQNIGFEFCPAEIGINNLFLWEPTKCMEALNTKFPVDDSEIKTKLLPIADVPRMSTIAIAAIIDRAVERLPQGQAYLNIGVWNGYSFLAGLLNNPKKRCIGVDNFSQFGGPVEDFMKRFERFRSDSHSFYDLDYEVYLRTVHKEPLGLYFYDGEHSYENQYKGLKAAEKFFAPGCLIMVDDTNWDEPRQATLDFMNNSRQRYRLVLDVRTPYSGHPTWWNGLMLLEYVGPIRKKVDP